MLKVFRILIILFFLSLGGVILFSHFYYGDYQYIFKKLVSYSRGYFDPTGYIDFEIPSSLIPQDTKQEGEIQTEFAIVADSHGDSLFYPRILKEIKGKKPDFFVHLGDFVEVGAKKDLLEAKKLLDETEILYYPVCGNHDHNFWPFRTTANYQEFFGSLYYTFEKEGVYGIVLNNSSGSIGIDEAQMEWLEQQLENSQEEKVRFVFLHIPPWHPFFTHIMGEESEIVKNQARKLLNLAQKYEIEEIFSGHVHVYARYKDRETGVKITTVGASGTDRNPVPGYVWVTVYKNGSYRVENINLLKEDD